MRYLTKQDIEEFAPAGLHPPDELDPAKPLRSAMQRYGIFKQEQLAGRVFPIACVALEITQRCNLDCTLCYLSDLAEAVQDVPLFELERRLDVIHRHYGDYTTIQITGGDPTLRSIPELVKIVEMVKSRNMRAALFTNGIKASRKMLLALSDAGLDDVVYHVDLTQERQGYETEAELNAIRLEYIGRASGLPLRVIFNTTVFDGNFEEIPRLVSFFCDHADAIDFASFQMQADTGRGILRERDSTIITQQTVMAALEKGARTKLGFDHPLVGHPDCNKYTAVMVCGSERTRLFDDEDFFGEVFNKLAILRGNWADTSLMTRKAIGTGLRHPGLLIGGLKFWTRKLWALRRGLLAGKRIHRINFFIHNFMDAERLERERCESCVFMVATAEGPLSMCVHNAKRDEMISKPVRNKDNRIIWNPLPNAEVRFASDTLPLKKMKGRLRKDANQQRKALKKVS
ncbi:MAG: radical SAM protein [Pseudomonadota bacterium]